MKHHAVVIAWLMISHASVFGIGYYVGHRGLQGVKKDFEDVKKDYQDLKAKVASLEAKSPV